MQSEFRFKFETEEEKDLSQRSGGGPSFYKFLLLTSYAWLREFHFDHWFRKEKWIAGLLGDVAENLHFRKWIDLGRAPKTFRNQLEIRKRKSRLPENKRANR
jgi:hypothetical protein